MFHFKPVIWMLILTATLFCGAAIAGVQFQPEHAALGFAAFGATRPFPIDPKMTAIAIAYRNPDATLIADDVLPRTPTAQEFKWMLYDKSQGFTVPDAQVGRKSLPNEVDFGGQEITDKVINYGLDDIVPNEDIQADNQGVGPLGLATGFLTGLVNLAREIRAANLVFNATTYPSANKVTLSGTSQWSDKTNSDPIAAISDALDTVIVRPNIGILGRATWTKLRRHPLLVQAVFGTNQGAGMITRQQFAELFELQELYVGEGFVNTAKKGQTAAMQRAWGKHAAFIYRDRAAGPQTGMTFGYTAQFGDKIAGMIDEPKLGLTGSVRVRSGERVKEIVSASDLGYFFESAVA